MAVYVDRCIIPWKGKVWCHMGADTISELHKMADKIGLKREWFQNKNNHPHYDITNNKRIIAIKNGAIEVKSILLKR